MLKFFKGESVKIIEPQSDLIPVLRADGWHAEGEALEPEIEDLKAKADALGIKYHHKAGVAKLKELIEGQEE